MPTVDAALLLQPLIATAFSVGLVVFWRFKKRLTAAALLLSLLSYSSAIIAKAVVQSLTAAAVVKSFGYVSIPTGLYLGIQTSVFEVGFAYLASVYAAHRRWFTERDGVGFGISLAFWENGVLLGAIALFNLVVLMATLSSEVLPLAVQNQLVRANPNLFLPPGQALPLALWGSLERLSSSLVHVSWGYLCVLAAATAKRRYFAIAFPMGLIDALVPLAKVVTVAEFETLIFAISLLALLVLWLVGRRVRRAGLEAPGHAPSVQTVPDA